MKITVFVEVYGYPTDRTQDLVIPAGKYISYGVEGDIYVEGCPTGQDSYFRVEGTTHFTEYPVEMWNSDDPCAQDPLSDGTRRIKKIVVADEPFTLTQYCRNYAYGPGEEDPFEDNGTKESQVVTL